MLLTRRISCSRQPYPLLAMYGDKIRTSKSWLDFMSLPEHVSACYRNPIGLTVPM
jgi:hypothetical protein